MSPIPWIIDTGTPPPDDIACLGDPFEDDKQAEEIHEETDMEVENPENDEKENLPVLGPDASSSGDETRDLKEDCLQTSSDVLFTPSTSVTQSKYSNGDTEDETVNQAGKYRFPFFCCIA